MLHHSITNTTTPEAEGEGPPTTEGDTTIIHITVVFMVIWQDTLYSVFVIYSLKSELYLIFQLTLDTYFECKDFYLL